MPIVTPTADEIERMDGRQRAALARRVPAQRAAFEESMALLVASRAPRPAASRRGIPAAKYRSREIADARFLLGRMPLDPDADRHFAALLKAMA